MGSGCNPCDNTSPNSFNPLPKVVPTGCGDCQTDASCIVYTGPNLICLGVESGDSAQDLFQAIDSKVCSVIGDWSGFNYHCLADDYVITNPETFVNAITEEFCTLKEEFTTFSESTYTSAITNIQTQINQINNPNLTLCTYSGIVSSDSYNSILTKVANKLCDLNSRLDLSTVVWNGCYTVVTPPTTIPQAFQLLSDQICQTVSGIVQPTLPTFNNQGSCLPSPGTADTLVATIGKIKTRLCQTPVYDINLSPWGCITNPDLNSGANIQAAFDAVLTATNALIPKSVTFDTDYFITSYNTPGQPCSGTFVTLDTDAINASDRLVAASPSDPTPGTLIEKLTSGSGNVTIDDTTNPGEITITVDAGTDQLVKVNGSDPTAGYLGDKVNGVTNATKGISISVPVNGSTNKVDITPDIDAEAFGTWFFDQVMNNTTLYNMWCTLNCGCAPCGGSSTTTSTTTIPSSTLRIYFENQDVSSSANINIVLNQNSPTVGFINNGFTILASGAVATGYYNLTTPINPKTVSLTVSNPDFGVTNYDVAIEVKQGSSGPIIPGTSSYSTSDLDTYMNTNFNIGSISGDIVIKITISNILPA